MPSHLTDFFRLVLEASWQGSLVILLILLVRPLMGSHVPARWRHLLWTLVIIRLLIPVSAFPPSPVSMQNIGMVDRPLEQVGLLPSQTRDTEPYLSAVRQGPETSESPLAPVSPPPVKSFPISWWTAVAVIWLAGMLLSLGVMICAQALLWRRLGKIRVPVDPVVLAIWDKCRQRLHIRGSPNLRMSPDIVSPALLGLFRPVLLLPEKNLTVFSPEDWENVFVHELAHYRRADHWIHALQLVALAVHWFNPLVWLGFRQSRGDRELAADEWALRHLEPERSAAYGDTLLKVLAQSSPRNVSLASVGILEDRVQLKQRLQRIVGFGPRTFIGSLLGLGIVIALSLLVLGRHVDKVDLSNYDGMKPEEILVEAAQRGDVPVIGKMLHDGVDVNTISQVTGSEQTALTAAAAAGQLEALRFLTSKGADINRKVDKSRSPVLTAMDNGWADCASYLLEKGAVCEPALVAAFRGDQPALQAYLQKEPADFDQLNHMSRIAADNGQADAFRLIAAKIKTQPGQNYWQLDDGAVVRAIARGHRDVIQAVLDESSSFKKLNQFGVMRIGGAAAQSPGMREWLISKGFTVPDYTDGERLIDAAEQEDLPGMERLLKKGVDINYRGESSWTPITKAATWGKVHSVKFLLAHGADPNSVHLPGWDYTGICLTGKPEIADMLLAAGGNLNATLYKRGVHIMDYCVVFGPTEMVKWFLDHGVDPTKVKADGEGRTFLFDAANPEIAELLIQHGVDPKAKTKQGETALYWVCMLGKKPAETARVLLKHGADPNARTDFGATPLMAARDGATVDVLVEYGADLKVKTRDGLSVLEASGNSADASRIEALVRHGVPFDPKTNGPTMLMRAAWTNQLNLMSYLLDHGVDPNAKGLWNKAANDYMTPLTAAVTDGQYDAVKLLVEHGATIQEPDENGKKGVNEMENALHNRRTQMVKLFWERGDRSISELTYAISQGRPVDEIQKLLDGGMPVDPPQDKGIRPLKLAAELGRTDVVTLLVQRGAKADDKSHAPLAQAAWEGQDEVVAYLLQHGAKVDYQTVWNAVWNCNPYPDQRSKDHFEKTIRLLIDAGGLKGFSEHQSADILIASIFTRYPSGNPVVVKMLMDAGVSLKARNEQGKSALDLVRDACKQTTCSTPTKEMLAFLDQADKK